MRRREFIAAVGGAAVAWPLAAILSFAVFAIGLQSVSAQECDYTTCGALMERDGSASGQNAYSADTKRACAELNACVRRTKSNLAGQAAAAPAATGSSSLKSSPNSSATVFNPKPADKQTKDMQPVSKSALHETPGNGVPKADHSNGKPAPCFAVAEILVPVDCSP